MDNIFDSLLDNVSYSINGLDTAIENGMAEHGLNFLRGGCGMFLLANMANSYYNNEKQMKASEAEFKKSMEFQSEMQALQDAGMEERFREETAFKRAYAAQARNNMLQIASAQLESRRELGKIKYFLEHSWPLSATVPGNMLTALGKPNYSNEALHVINMRPQLCENAKEESAYFDYVEDKVEEVLSSFSKFGIAINYDKGVCKEDEINTGNASLMNIHFWLSPQPTIVISPRYDEQEHTMQFKVALWNIQTPRPMIRNIFSIPYNVQILDYESLNAVAFSLAAIAGISCDKYAAFCLHHIPAFSRFLEGNACDEFCRFVSKTETLKKYIDNEIEEMKAILASKAPVIKELFTEYETAQMSRAI